LKFVVRLEDGGEAGYVKDLKLPVELVGVDDSEVAICAILSEAHGDTGAEGPRAEF